MNSLNHGWEFYCDTDSSEKSYFLKKSCSYYLYFLDLSINFQGFMSKSEKSIMIKNDNDYIKFLIQNENGIKFLTANYSAMSSLCLKSMLVRHGAHSYALKMAFTNMVHNQTLLSRGHEFFLLPTLLTQHREVIKRDCWALPRHTTTTLHVLVTLFQVPHT